MLKVYPAILHEEDGYWVEFPDLEGCQTCGDTLEETMKLAEEALGIYLVSLEENHQFIPAPSKISNISFDDGQPTYVLTDVDAYRRTSEEGYPFHAEA